MCGGNLNTGSTCKLRAENSELDPQMIMNSLDNEISGLNHTRAQCSIIVTDSSIEKSTRS